MLNFLVKYSNDECDNLDACNHMPVQRSHINSDGERVSNALVMCKRHHTWGNKINEKHWKSEVESPSNNQPIWL